ncbi:MAG: hypothetical protein ACRDA7_02735 [Metamycoplasmataceae bacterium]
MNKKSLITLGSLSTMAIVTPVLITISCANEPVTTINLTITAKDNPKLTKADVTILENITADNTAKWDALSKLFTGEGFINDNKDKFTTSINTTDMLVTLTAVKGYTIGGKEKIVSNKYTEDESVTPIDLAIKPKDNPKLTTTEETQLESGTDEQKQVALAMLFDPITAENYKNFSFTINKDTKIVTLTAKQGFVFGNSDTLNSNAYIIDKPIPAINLKITIKASPKLTPTDIIILEGNYPLVQLPVLQKLFEGEGLISANQDKFTILVDTNKKIVTLKANTGYTINNAEALVSNQYTIDTTPPTNTNLILTTQKDPILTKDDINNLLTGTDTTKKLESLKKLFGGADLTIANMANFDIDIDQNNKLVTLIAKINYSINGEKIFASNPYKDEVTSPAIDLTITPTSSVILTNNDVTALEGSNAVAKWTVLEKLFKGKDFLSTNIGTKFTITFNKANLEVTLTAETGFTINGQLTLSNVFVIPTNLIITAKTGTITLTTIDLMDIEDQHIPKKVAALSKLFDGIDVMNQVHLEIKIDQGNKITLTTYPGYTINGKETLSSNQYQTINSNLNITAKSNVKLFSSEDATINEKPSYINRFDQLAVLEKLFEGISIANYQYFTFEVTNKVVSLKAKPGIVFGANPNSGQNTLLAPAYSLYINLDILPIPQTAALSAAEIADLQGIDKFKQLVVLKKLFQGSDLTSQNQANFKVSVNTFAKLVILSANDGYAFSGFSLFLNTVYTNTKNILTITAKDNPTLTRQEEAILDQSSPNYAQQLPILQKLFDGVTKDNQKFFFIVVNRTKRIITLTIDSRNYSDYIFSNNTDKVPSNTYTIS